MRLALALALLCALVFAAPAEAYKRFPFRFPSKTITYYNTASKYKKDVAAAAEAWNKSGTKARWKPASKSRARVRIKITKNLAPAGLATYYGNGRGLIELQPALEGYAATEIGGRIVTRQVIAHEMGHIMGLNHETKKCAVMQPAIGVGCPNPKVLWQVRCRVLEKDDIRGGVALFGGKVGKVGPEFCDAVEEPEAPTGISVVQGPADDEDAGAQVTWTTPNGKDIESVRVMRRRDTCPTGAENDTESDFVGQEDATPGKVQSTSDSEGFPTSGTYCYTVQAFGKFNRPGKIATFLFQYTGPPAPGMEPTADFDYDSDDGQTYTFEDYSEAADDGAEIVSWQWDFADGGSSNVRNPSHTFAPRAEGYSVTLTVTDNQGRTDTATRTIYVDEPVDTGG